MQNLDKEVQRCVDGRADVIHMDVMDGKFVPNVTFDSEELAHLRPLTVITLDTHLMSKSSHKKLHAKNTQRLVAI